MRLTKVKITTDCQITLKCQALNNKSNSKIDFEKFYKNYKAKISKCMSLTFEAVG